MSSNQRWWIPIGILCLGPACGPESSTLLEQDAQQREEPEPLCGNAFVEDVVRQFGTTGTDRPTGVSLDPDGNVFIAGNTDGDFGEPAEKSLGQDIFLAKLNTSLNFQWAHQLGSRGDDSAWDVVSASDGSAYVVGLTSDEMPGQRTAGGSDLFSARYDAAGNRTWIVQRGTAGEDYALSASIRPNNQHLVLTGAEQNSEDYDFDVIVDELDAAGEPSGRANFGSSRYANDRGEGVATRADGTTWLVGSTQGALSDSAPAGSTDVFIRQLDDRYNTQWTKQVGTPDIDAALEVVPDGSDRIYVLALSYSNLETGQAENDGIPNAFLMRYSTSGERRWVKRIGAANKMSLATGLTVDAQGNAYVAGWTTGQMTTEQNHGGTDAFVAQYDRFGNRVRSWQWGTTADDDVRDIVLTSATTAVAVGTTSGDLASPGSNQGGQDVFAVKFSTSP
ncbi:SBBP repeat-containing protein [Corallococcus sp. CA053C]|uniref:SBBP repeat-containing protein n=1 Tax=Corallococcus sp. CA053C TaxID=2316732 RepID=UPI0013154813|nr:SBBP repeat-containing protein [Corallococcus sp. CA053C]